MHRRSPRLPAADQGKTAAAARHCFGSRHRPDARHCATHQEAPRAAPKPSARRPGQICREHTHLRRCFLIRTQSRCDGPSASVCAGSGETPLRHVSSTCNQVCLARRWREHRARELVTWNREQSAEPCGDYTDMGGPPMNEFEKLDLYAVKRALMDGARALGFSKLGVTRVEIPEDSRHLLRWLEAGCHGEMDYMQRHGTLRARPQD